MSNHKVAIVPLASGYHQSPDLFAKRRKADTGIFAESLIYYDSVYVHVDNPEQFADFISLLIQQGLSYEALNDLIEAGCLRFLSTVLIMPFIAHPHLKRTLVSGFYAVQEEAMKQPNYFSKRFLEFEGLRNSFSSFRGIDKKAFDKFCQLAEQNSITLSGEDIGEGIIDNSYEDFLNPDRCKLIAENILGELYKIHRLGRVPEFDVKIREMNAENWAEIANNPRSGVFRLSDNRIFEVEYSINTDNFKSLENSEKLIATFETLPLSCAGVSNLYIKAAGTLETDLFLPKPMSNIVGDKLYEISDVQIHQSALKIENVIDKLEASVEFPALRRIINSDQIDFSRVLELRKNSSILRECLQTSSGNDVNAFIAYHSEVAKQSGFTNIGKKSLKVFGMLASLGWSIFLEVQFKENIVIKETAKTVGGKIIDGLLDYGTKKLGKDWKPICFGDWYKEEIARLLKESRDR